MLRVVRCHAPTKRVGDASADAFCKFVQDAATTTSQDKSQLFVYYYYDQNYRALKYIYFLDLSRGLRNEP